MALSQIILRCNQTTCTSSISIKFQALNFINSLTCKSTPNFKSTTWVSCARMLIVDYSLTSHQHLYMMLAENSYKTTQYMSKDFKQSFIFKSVILIRNTTAFELSISVYACRDILLQMKKYFLITQIQTNSLFKDLQLSSCKRIWNITRNSLQGIYMKHFPKYV